MRSVEAIEQALRAALPAEHQSQALALARALIDHVDGSTSAPLPPKLEAALHTLAGQNITAGDSVLNFGLGNHFGDVTIGELVGRDKITITLALPTSPLSPQERRNRQALIRNVRTVVIAPLDRLLSEEPYLELALAEHPDAVSGTPTLLARAAPPKPAQIPHGTPIVEVFDQRGGALLILGAPGAGKTVLLLELCRALLERAERDEQLPIPVVFNLASWSARHTSLADWMLEELDTNFNVSQKTARQWVEEEEAVILPLLDGLDEVAPSARGPCVRAINAYHGDHPVPLAVCARETDYRAIGAKLHRLGTVLVKPLSDAQIVAYLERSGEVLTGLRQALTHDADLCELATSPLMLSVMAVAYAYKPAEAIVEAADHRALWDTYLDAMFRRGAPGRSLGRAQALTYLRWLAGALQRHPQAVFHLEHLQPDWLPTSTDRRWYTIADRLGSAVLVGGVALALCLPMSESLVALTVALACAVVAGLYGGRPQTLVHGRWPAREVARDVLVGGLVAGAVIAPLQGVVDGLNAALIGATAAALAGGPSLRPRPIVTVEALHWSWRRALRVGAVGLGSGILVGLVNGMIIGGRWLCRPGPRGASPRPLATRCASAEPRRVSGCLRRSLAAPPCRRRLQLYSGSTCQDTFSARFP